MQQYDMKFYRTMYDQVNVFNGDYIPVEQTANVDKDINVGSDDSVDKTDEVKEESNNVFFNINKSISQELSIVLIGILAIQMAILISK